MTSLEVREIEGGVGQARGKHACCKSTDAQTTIVWVGKTDELTEEPSHLSSHPHSHHSASAMLTGQLTPPASLPTTPSMYLPRSS